MSETTNPVRQGLPDVSAALDKMRLSNRTRLIRQLELNIQQCKSVAAVDSNQITRREDLALENLFRLIRFGLKHNCLHNLQFSFAGEVNTTSGKSISKEKN